MQYIVFDLEATCWEGNLMGRLQEIIEIGAIRLNRYGQEQDRYQRFVRPLMHPTLSVYCRQLTGIAQEEIDDAREFASVGPEFMHWIEETGEEYSLCSWGSKDKLLLESACDAARLDKEWLQTHIDLKSQYHEIKGFQRRMGLKKSLQGEGIPFEGNHHRAMDDAENLSQLFLRYLDMWVH